MTSFADSYDVLLLDLDGTLYRGPDPVPGTVEVLRSCSITPWYVTNNASRSDVDVAAHLTELGFDAQPHRVITSAGAAARYLATVLDPGSRVLVVGTGALVDAVAAVGLAPVRSAEVNPVAVVQGHSPTTDWAIIAEATYAIRAGAMWVATNTDATLPTPRGLGPGNGSMVAAVRTATGSEPTVTGKPWPPIMRDALQRSGASSALVVGDRLDTDIAGAVSIGLDSLLVLTGVSTVADLLGAAVTQRPTFVAFDLEALHGDSTAFAVGSAAQHWSPLWSATVREGVLEVEYRPDGLDTVTAPADPADTIDPAGSSTVGGEQPMSEDAFQALRAALASAWAADAPVTSVIARDDRAAAAIAAWKL